MIPRLLLSLFLLGSAPIVSAQTASPRPLDPAKFREPIRVACVGDSITQGVGAAEGQSYPDQLQRLLGGKWKVGNCGVSGCTLLRKGDRPYWIEAAFERAREFAPNAVIIMLGTNDTKPQNWVHSAEFFSDYRDLVRTFLALPTKPSVYVCRPVPGPESGNFGINEANIQKEIPLVDKLARELNVEVIDMHAALRAHPEMRPDRVHPNAAGAAEMARAAYHALTGEPAPAARD